MDLTDRHELLRTAVTYSGELTCFLKGRVSDSNDAHDLLQELYLAVLKLPASQAIVRHPKAYLFTIAAHLAHQHWERIRSRPPHLTLDDAPPEVFQTVHTALEQNLPEFEAALSQRLSAVQQRLSELSPEVQAAVLLHHRDGYTCDEIAKKLSVVRNRVKKYLVRGLTHCRAAPHLA
jgi:RNA polymerase sigma-70 factor (ECF subfamily)